MESARVREGNDASQMNVPEAGRTLTPLSRWATLGYSAGALLDGIAGQGVNIFLFFYYAGFPCCVDAGERP